MHLWDDLKYGARHLRRTPAFTFVAVLALGIGVGANITIFLFVNQWLLRPLDARDPGQMIRVTGPGGDTSASLATENEAHIALGDYLAYRDRNQTFSALTASHIGGPARVRSDGPAQMVVVTPVSGNFFDVFGVPAAMGRTLRPDDAKWGARPVIVLTDVGWRRFFHARPDIVGSVAYINGEATTVVGVLPPWFRGVNVPMVPQIYGPLIDDRPGAFPYRVQVIGRMKPGVTPAQARADIARIASDLNAADGGERSIEIFPARAVMPFALRGVSALVGLFALIVVVVLLIACDNVAIFMALRSAARSREIGIRVALGATRAQLIRQLLIESALVSVASGIVGMYSAWVTARFVGQFYLPVPVPFALTFTMDWRVVMFAVGASCVATLLCGLAPARRALKADVVAALRQSSPGGRVQSGLVITQATLSTALLITAVVLGHSLTARLPQPRGFTSAKVVMATVPLTGNAFTPQRRQAVFNTLLERFEHAPGVLSAAMVDNIPLANNTVLPQVTVRSGNRTAQASVNAVSRGLFQTLGIALLAGRDFAASDDARAESVAVVNETLAQALWPDETPIGKHLEHSGRSIEIIGMVRDSKYVSLQESPRPFIYRPVAALAIASPTFLIKGTGDTAALLAFVRARLTELDPDLVAYNLMPLDDRLGLGLIVNRAAATVSGALGLLGIALGSFGLYGTMSFLVALRRREIGVRLALGAPRRSVMTLIAKRGMAWAGIGVLLGLVTAWIAALGLNRFLSGVSASDPLAFAAAPLVLAATAYLACHVPARRAARLDPLDALREE
ncbi:MAG TPA: ABC transporter permease [Vicinamibacterales bacterium]